MPFIIITGIIIVICIILLVAIFTYKKEESDYEYEQRQIKNAGKMGEYVFNKIMYDILNNDDILLNNVELDVNGKEAEIDNLIINKNGIFIIEVKNYVGTLYGTADDYEWEKEKTSPGGNVFTKQVKNPIRQIKRQVYILSQYLKENNIRIWIEGYAYFVNSNSPVENEYILNDIYELEQIIHRKQNKVYDDKKINKAVRLLSMCE